jgi:hypothetical protein
MAKITNREFCAVTINLNVIDSDGNVVHSGSGDYSNPDFRRWMGETCRVAFSKGHKVTTTPVKD